MLYLFYLIALIGLFLQGKSYSNSDVILILVQFYLTFFVINLCAKASLTDLVFALKVFSYFSLILLSIETIIRIYFPDPIKMEHMGKYIDTFYRFKHSSIMFPDSNYTALYTILLCMLILYIHVFYRAFIFRKFIILFILANILNILTFSRAVILGTVFFYYFFCVGFSGLSEIFNYL